MQCTELLMITALALGHANIDEAFEEVIDDAISQGSSDISEASTLNGMYIGEQQVYYVGYRADLEARYACVKTKNGRKKYYWFFDGDQKSESDENLKRGKKIRVSYGDHLESPKFKKVRKDEVSNVRAFFKNEWQENEAMPSRLFSNAFVPGNSDAVGRSPEQGLSEEELGSPQETLPSLHRQPADRHGVLRIKRSEVYPLTLPLVERRMQSSPPASRPHSDQSSRKTRSR